MLDKTQKLVGTLGAARLLQRSEQRARQLADSGRLPTFARLLDTGRRVFLVDEVERLSKELNGGAK